MTLYRDSIIVNVQAFKKFVCHHGAGAERIIFGSQPVKSVTNQTCHIPFSTYCHGMHSRKLTTPLGIQSSGQIFNSSAMD